MFCLDALTEKSSYLTVTAWAIKSLCAIPSEGGNPLLAVHLVHKEKEIPSPVLQVENLILNASPKRARKKPSPAKRKSSSKLIAILALVGKVASNASEERTLNVRKMFSLLKDN